jgi:outer membrane protein assembly factor BamA
LAGGVGFRNDLGIRLFAETSYGSLWRRNHTIFFNSSANRRFDEEFCSNSLPGRFYEATGNCFIEGSAQLGYRWPWFVFDKVTFRPRITVERVQFRKFDADSLSVSPAWERAILRSPNLTGVLTYNLERIKQYHAQDVLDNGQFTIGSVTPSIYVDMRDDPLSPTRGIFSTFSYEVANRLFFSQTEPIPVGFTRAQFRTDFFHSFSSDLMIYLSFRSGIERNTEPPSVGTPDPKRYSIPISKQFVLGGAGSIRGFKEQELNTENSPILGTLSYVNYRAQVDFPFSGALRFGPFVDAANLLIDDYSFGRLRFGAGAGFRYRSPVGPINFDWGFKIAPRPGEDTSQFYFSVGVI